MHFYVCKFRVEKWQAFSNFVSGMIKKFLHFPGIFHHAVNNLFTVQIIFFTGFYKENLKKCVISKSSVENKIFYTGFPKSVWKIFSTLILENKFSHFCFPHTFSNFPYKNQWRKLFALWTNCSQHDGKCLENVENAILTPSFTQIWTLAHFSKFSCI